MKLRGTSKVRDGDAAMWIVLDTSVVYETVKVETRNSVSTSITGDVCHCGSRSLSVCDLPIRAGGPAFEG